MASLSHHLLGQTRSAVLATLLLRPETALHVRELARITGASPGSLHRELRSLTELGLLRKTSGLADVLRAALAPLAARIALAFVYGSIASDKARALSDVDVMVLGDAGFAELVSALAPAQATLGREVNVTPMTPTDFARKLAEGDGFAASVMPGERIWLMGNDDDLAKLAQDRPAQGARAHPRGNAAAAGRGRTKPR